jgi:hypothetical protein
MKISKKNRQYRRPDPGPGPRYFKEEWRDFLTAGDWNLRMKAARDTPQEKVNDAISDARTYLAKDNCAKALNKLLGTKVGKKAKSPLDMLNKVDGKVYLINAGANDPMIAHSVLPGDSSYNTVGKYSQGDTILVSRYFINNTRKNIGFDQLTTSERDSVTDRQARAVIIIHELLHLYTGMGHGSAPETQDWRWNDYIYWVCLKDQKIQGWDL